jgi:flagellar motor switch protein FliM
MSHEVLNQSGIDRVLQTERLQGRMEVRPVNILEAPRLGNDRLGQMGAIASRFAGHLQALFSGKLRSAVDVTVHSVDEVSAGEYLASLQQPCAAFHFAVGDESGSKAIFDFGHRLGQAFVEAQFGGDIFGEDGHTRQPSGIDQRVLEEVMGKVMSHLQESWSAHLLLSPSEERFEASPDGIEVIARGDSCLVFSLQVIFRKTAHYVTLCMPLSTLEPLFAPRRGGALRPPMDDSDVVIDDPHRRAMQFWLRQTPLTLSIRYPSCTLTPLEAHTLAVGQVIDLGMATHGVQATLHAPGRPLALGSVGRDLGRRAYQLDSFILNPPERDAAWAPPARIISSNKDVAMEDSQNLGLKHLQRVKLKVDVLAGETVMTMGEVEKLRPGSTLILDRRHGDPFQLSISDQVLAEGELVEVPGNDHLGFRVTKVYPQPEGVSPA